VNTLDAKPGKRSRGHNSKAGVGAVGIETVDTRDLPIRDPAPHLAPTGQRILDAARRILDRDGFDALTFEAIAAESGENRASIRYHFGSKAGLIGTLVDAVMYEGSVAVIRAVMESPSAAERRHALIDVHRQIALEREEYATFFDLIPRILRDAELRERFKQLFVWYRDIDSWALASADDQETRATFRPLATLTTAVLDGLALQIQADPDFDIDPAFELWQRMVQDYVERLSAE
jgi:AcrR family transcriptional regulator